MADSNRTLIEDFYASFNTTRTDLSSRIDAFKVDASKSGGILDRISVDIAKLRRELVNATGFLPAYDQRQYELQVKAFEQSLEQLRIAAAPKPKFAFKRKQPVPNCGQVVADVKKATVPQPSTSAAAALSNDVRALSGHTNAYLSMSSLPVTSSTSGSELTISDIDHCIIDLIPSLYSSGGSEEGADVITALHVKNVTNSVLLVPTLSGSAILHDVKDSVLVIGCHQFRMHSSSHVDVYLSIPSKPIIEHCSGVRFTGYPAYLREHGSVNETANKHLSVQDFTHIRATPSPNWRPLPESAIIAQDLWPRAPLQGDIATVLKSLLPSS